MMLDNLIREEDVPKAAGLVGLGEDGFAPVNGDESRLRAMLRLDTVDFEACPGSGKTTLLVAKLAVLALRWPHLQQGICVLSHTNAARNEISTKLSNSSAGIALTSYPHFVGTIHSFVNEFLALPWLRSKGIEVQCIDTQMAVFKRWQMLPMNTRTALEKKRISPYHLTYKTTDYSVGELGSFGPHTPTNKMIVDANRFVSERGYFCFDEMFVWANELLDRRPETVANLRHRFPLVFIDEAQDNSEMQSSLLYRVFCEGEAPSRRQRFGDSNQAIYSRSNQAGAETDPFPGHVVHSMPCSYRFGQELADRVKGFGVNPQALVGRGPPNQLGVEAKASVIFLFDDGSVESVLGRYGAYLVENFDSTMLDSGTFAAVAGVHELNKDGRIPHAIGHYVPTYDPACSRKETALTSFAQYLARARFETIGSSNLNGLVNATAAALMAASELAGGKFSRIARKSPHRRVIQMLAETPAAKAYLALQELVLVSKGRITPAVWTAQALPNIEMIIKQLSGARALDESVAGFLASLPMENMEAEQAVYPARSDNIFVYPSAAPQVRIKLGSIHSVKGETHTATLVLDSFFRSHHLRELKPWLLGDKCGGSTSNKKGKQVSEGSVMLSRLKLHYVAMTRPTHLLCLAMRKDAFNEGEIERLEQRGWRIIDCCAPIQG